ncbi:MAG: hypothetical protein ACRDCB_02435 [Clostridium sp.]
MLRSVYEISVLTGLSKVSIYNKIKLKEFDKFIFKTKGITYVSDEGVTLICESFNLKESDLNNLNCKQDYINDEVAIDIENKEIEEFKVELKELKQNYINSLKSEIEILKNQLNEKDKQIENVQKLLEHSQKLVENNQILLKQQQDKEINELKLVDHFKEVDNKLIDLKNKMDNKKKENNRFFKFFSR